MADNYQVRDGVGAAIRLSSEEVDTGVHAPRSLPHLFDAFAAGVSASIGTSATALAASAVPLSHPVTLVNHAGNSTEPIWVGGSGVTVGSNGFPLGVGESVRLWVSDLAEVYAITTGASKTLHYLEGEYRS